MKHARLITALCVAAAPSCAGASPWPTLNLSWSSSFATGRAVEARSARTATRLGAALRWHARRRPLHRVGAAIAAAEATTRQRETAPTCGVEAACAWEEAARSDALAVLTVGEP